LAFAEELGAEEDVVRVVFLPDVGGEADGDGGFDHHDGVGVDGQDLSNHGFDGGGVEEVLLGVVVGGSADDNVVGVPVGAVAVGGGAQVERVVLQVVADLFIYDGGDASVYHVHFALDDVYGDHVVVLAEQH